MVIPLNSDHYTMLARNLLYTGLARGKRLVALVGQRRVLAIAVRNGVHSQGERVFQGRASADVTLLGRNASAPTPGCNSMPLSLDCCRPKTVAGTPSRRSRYRPLAHCGMAVRGLPRHHFDPVAAWSGTVKGSSLELTTKIASKLASALPLAFSLIR